MEKTVVSCQSSVVSFQFSVISCDPKGSASGVRVYGCSVGNDMMRQTLIDALESQRKYVAKHPSGGTENRVGGVSSIPHRDIATYLSLGRDEGNDE